MSFLESFRAARWLRTVNLVLQAILFVSFFVGLNYLALHYKLRLDLTPLRQQSLSPETRSYIEHLTQPVHIVVTLTNDANNTEVAQAYRDISQILREYAFATETNSAGHITVDYLDIYQRRREAEQLGIVEPNTILVISGQNRQLVQIPEIYRWEQKQKVAFIGEETLTAAILNVTSPERKKIYFLTGHGEMDLLQVDPNRGLSELRDQLSVRNFLVDTLQLSITRKIPEDAALLVAAGPNGPYEPYEEELLRNYLNSQSGRLLLLVGPGKDPGLDRLFDDWGIRSGFDKDLIIYDSGQTGQNDTGDLILNQFAPHPITQPMINFGYHANFGVSRCVRDNPSRANDAGLVVTRLIAPSKTAWGHYMNRGISSTQFNPKVDVPAKALAVAVASERVTPEAKLNLPFNVRGGRLAVFGCSDFVANNRIISQGNLTLILSAVNWAVDRDAQLNVPARPIEKYKLTMNLQDFLRLRYTLLFVLPAAAAFLGLIVYWTRRS